MSDVMPCPNCKSTELRLLGPHRHRVECQTCGLMGPYGPGEITAGEKWQAIPRTRWVHVSERLPTSGETLPIITRTGTLLHGWLCSDGVWEVLGWTNVNVTHWLDGIPPQPPHEPQE